MAFAPPSPANKQWRSIAYRVIFQTDTRAGWIFDATLLAAILLSILVISLETVQTIGDAERLALRRTEWVLTALFTIEYVLRLAVVPDPRRYALSLLGIIDLVSLLPTYLSVFVADAQALQIIRALRLLRVFRVFQLGPFLHESNTLLRALYASRFKIGVFLGTILIVVVIQGALIYFFEHQVNERFTSIPRAIYWAVVTLTTVGYGDISPVTVPGQLLATVLMLLGYGVIAVPTGIVTAQLTAQDMKSKRKQERALVHPHALRPDWCAAPLPEEAVVDGAELGQPRARTD